MTACLLAAIHPAALGAQAQAPPTPCTAPEYRQFDFWLGTWEVFAPTGQPAGRNIIEAALNGCAIHESWESAGGSTGHSYTFYDVAAENWHQTWIDSNGAPLYLDGAFENGRMVLSDGTNRITWSQLPEGKVRQHWEITRDAGETWTTGFDGEYRPVELVQPNAR